MVDAKNERKRKWKIEVYILSGFAVFIIFALAFCLSYIYAEHVLSPNMENDLSSASSSMLTLLTIKMLEENSSTFCLFYNSSFEKFDEDTWRLGGKLEMLEAKGLRDDDLKRKYFELEMRDYLLAKEAKKRCGKKDVLILYFYSNRDKECPDCWKQGQVLSEVRNEMKDKGMFVRVFSFDGALDSPVVDFLKTQHNITRYPTLIINEKKVVGFMDKEKIEKMIIPH